MFYIKKQTAKYPSKNLPQILKDKDMQMPKVVKRNLTIVFKNE